MDDYITTKNYDIGKGEIGRIISTSLRAKIIPHGNLGGGPQPKGMVILLLSHRLGRFVFPLIIPFEHYLHRIYLRLKR